MLKTIVDETSHGKYDFMYLRIGKKDKAVAILGFGTWKPVTANRSEERFCE